MTDNMFLKGSKNKPRVVSEHSGISQCLEIIKIKPCSTEHKILIPHVNDFYVQ